MSSRFQYYNTVVKVTFYEQVPNKNEYEGVLTVIQCSF
jgi:hypothetical protein